MNLVFQCLGLFLFLHKPMVKFAYCCKEISLTSGLMNW